MEKQAHLNLLYPQRIQWIDQQLKSGKELGEILQVQVKPYQQIVADAKADTLSCKVNHEVMRQWQVFTSTRKENTEALFSTALCEYMSNHQQTA